MRPWRSAERAVRAGRSAGRRRRRGRPAAPPRLTASRGAWRPGNQDPEHRERHQRADDAEEDQERHQADHGAPVRDHEHLGDVEDRVPEAVEGVDDVHDGMLPDEGRRRRGLPRFFVAPRPGFHGTRSSSTSRRRRAGSSAAGGCRPTGPTAAPDRADRAAIAYPPCGHPSPGRHVRNSRSSVTTSRPATPPNLRPPWPDRRGRGSGRRPSGGPHAGRSIRPRCARHGGRVPARHRTRARYRPMRGSPRGVDRSARPAAADRLRRRARAAGSSRRR